jgi:hypothetical protein
MVDYGKQKGDKKGTRRKGEDFAKKHKESISGLMDRQFIADISGQSVRNLVNNSVKKPVKQSYGVMRCTPERRLNGYC